MRFGPSLAIMWQVWQLLTNRAEPSSAAADAAPARVKASALVMMPKRFIPPNLGTNRAKRVISPYYIEKFQRRQGPRARFPHQACGHRGELSSSKSALESSFCG